MVRELGWDYHWKPFVYSVFGLVDFALSQIGLCHQYIGTWTAVVNNLRRFTITHQRTLAVYVAPAQQTAMLLAACHFAKLLWHANMQPLHLYRLSSKCCIHHIYCYLYGASEFKYDNKVVHSGPWPVPARRCCVQDRTRVYRKLKTTTITTTSHCIFDAVLMTVNASSLPLLKLSPTLAFTHLLKCTKLSPTLPGTC